MLCFIDIITFSPNVIIFSEGSRITSNRFAWVLGGISSFCECPQQKLISHRAPDAPTHSHLSLPLPNACIRGGKELEDRSGVTGWGGHCWPGLKPAYCMLARGKTGWEWLAPTRCGLTCEHVDILAIPRKSNIARWLPPLPRPWRIRVFRLRRRDRLACQ